MLDRLAKCEDLSLDKDLSIDHKRMIPSITQGWLAIMELLAAEE